MKIEQGTFCPLLKKDCITHKCCWFTHLRGKNPQSEEALDEYACAIAWFPILIVENSMMQRQTGAAVESLRNEGVTTGQQITNALMHVAEQKRLSNQET